MSSNTAAPQFLTTPEGLSLHYTDHPASGEELVAGATLNTTSQPSKWRTTDA